MRYPDYPFTSTYYDCNGHQMHYVAEGDPAQPAMVMVHGNPSWSFYYRHLIHSFKDRFYCVAPDHIGMGLSDKPDDSAYSYHLQQRIDDLEGFIDSLQLNEPFTLVVHDWGGMIGCGYAVRHPERIARMIICNTAAFRLPDNASFPWQLRMSRTLFGSLAIRGWNAFCTYAVKHCVTKAPLKKDVAQALLAPYDSWHNRRAVLRFVQDIPLNEQHPSWHTVQTVESALPQLTDIPKLLLWGCKDFVFTPAFLDHWQTLFPDAEVHRFEESGHYILEEEQEAIIPLITAFLERTACSSNSPAT